jgi:phosphoribosyl-AMP cyclohydrolase
MSATEIAVLLDAIQFDATGLVPVIAQAKDGGEVLMMAWMNRDAVTETLTTGRVCYWSRSRQSLWRKGETSGQVQHLIELRLDCDGDCLLAVVEQEGVACHTGRRSCFFNRAATDKGTCDVTSEPLISPQDLYKHGASH